MDEIKPGRKPYWKRLHHSWIFWVFLLLMFVGIMYYIITVNFLLVPDMKMSMPQRSGTL